MDSRTAVSAGEPGPAAGDERPRGRRLGQLRRLWGFAKPYRLQVVAAVLALTVAAATVLALGLGLRKLVDEGFASGDAALLDQCREEVLWRRSIEPSHEVPLMSWNHRLSVESAM